MAVKNLDFFELVEAGCIFHKNEFLFKSGDYDYSFIFRKIVKKKKEEKPFEMDFLLDKIYFIPLNENLVKIQSNTGKVTFESGSSKFSNIGQILRGLGKKNENLKDGEWRNNFFLVKETHKITISKIRSLLRDKIKQLDGKVFPFTGEKILLNPNEKNEPQIFVKKAYLLKINKSIVPKLPEKNENQKKRKTVEEKKESKEKAEATVATTPHLNEEIAGVMQENFIIVEENQKRDKRLLLKIPGISLDYLITSLQKMAPLKMMYQDNLTRKLKPLYKQKKNIIINDEIEIVSPMEKSKLDEKFLILKNSIVSGSNNNKNVFSKKLDEKYDIFSTIYSHFILEEEEIHVLTLFFKNIELLLSLMESNFDADQLIEFIENSQTIFNVVFLNDKNENFESLIKENFSKIQNVFISQVDFCENTIKKMIDNDEQKENAKHETISFLLQEYLKANNLENRENENLFEEKMEEFKNGSIKVQELKEMKNNDEGDKLQKIQDLLNSIKENNVVLQKNLQEESKNKEEKLLKQIGIYYDENYELKKENMLLKKEIENSNKRIKLIEKSNNGLDGCQKYILEITKNFDYVTKIINEIRSQTQFQNNDDFSNNNNNNNNMTSEYVGHEEINDVFTLFDQEN